MDYRQIKKAELHCHLDGSLDIPTTLEILKSEGKDYTLESLTKEMTVSPGCTSLEEYLQKFALPGSVMQTKEQLETLSYGLGKTAAGDGVKYIETRFAPSFHKQKGLSFAEIIESVDAGLKKAEAEFGIKTGIIVCAMRGLELEENLAMVKAAREFLGNGVVSCDLAGAETPYPVSQFADVFALAKKLDMPYTIHAGECGDPKSVWGAIELGASRIGHGVASVKDKNVMKLVKDKGILLELCPTSNLQTKAFDDISEYPILQFLDAGIKVNLNTDNRTVSGIDLTNEYELIGNTFMLTERDFDEMYQAAIETSFASDDVKNTLLK